MTAVAAASATPTQPTSATLRAHTAAYARLKAEVAQAGILNRSYRFYWALISFAFGGYFLSLWGILTASGFPMLLAGCLGFSFFTVQLAGLMHDAGHRAVFGSKRANEWLGIAASASIGMVFASWKQRHNRHHAYPNEEGADPDMEVPFLALSPGNYASKDRVQQLVLKWQPYYYYPLGAIVGITNRLGSLIYFMSDRSSGRFLRLAVYLPIALALFAGPFLLFDWEKALFVFLLVHLSTGVYLASCFAPNHKGMRTIAATAEISFLEQQVSTARNVSGGFLTDLLLVGLNRQVEHHLFPTCPRNKLRLLQPAVLRTCDERGIDYCEVGLITTNRMLVQHLARLSHAASQAQ